MSQDVKKSEDLALERGHWGGRLDFLLACIGNVVGLGNVWRFPYLCYRNGGGAFLIPYILMVFLVGLPVFLVELAVGQYSALGPLKAFEHLAPLCKGRYFDLSTCAGVGYASILASALVAIYYNMIMAWTVFYLVDSFRHSPRWHTCGHPYNTPRESYTCPLQNVTAIFHHIKKKKMCFSDTQYKSCKQNVSDNVYLGGQCYNVTYATDLNITEIPAKERVSPAEEYFKYVIEEQFLYVFVILQQQFFTSRLTFMDKT
ncbi:hypothetical protein LAZ67_3000262 [Cordylochernes scorpioides]|uniref:Transporter n=1 Tax=Cordylochernes scorpioides TaxID=51811 RepID=A0ABY6K629_9ARAC|nr:hypothetical protein LAZ67_3000262 [Cordylochernes scorpioides]